MITVITRKGNVLTAALTVRSVAALPGVYVKEIGSAADVSAVIPRWLLVLPVSAA